MPRIELITPVYYDAEWPYHKEYDNLPLRYIVARQELINSAVDQVEEVLRDSIGTQGTLANRLNQSINEDGSLSDDAIDEALHNIGAHTDGEYEGVEYVRMTAEERDKLSTIAEDATDITIEVENSISTTVEFADGPLVFGRSDTVTWEITSPNIVKANLAFPSSAAHQHYYDLVPVAANSSPDYTNYKTTSLSTAFVEDSLRIYVNGIRLSATDDIYVYSNVDGPSGDWELLSYTADHDAGTFTLSRAIDATDIITIDFDINLVD